MQRVAPGGRGKACLGLENLRKILGSIELEQGGDLGNGILWISEEVLRLFDFQVAIIFHNAAAGGRFKGIR